MVRTIGVRSPHGTRRSNDRPGRVGKPLTGGRETGEAMTASTMRGREMRTTETVLNVLSEWNKSLSVADLRKPDDGKLSRPV